VSKATDKAVINAGVGAGLAYLTGGASLGGKLPGLDLTSTTTVTSRLDQANASGSFNYDGPVINLPSVDQSAPFWASRGPDASMWAPSSPAIGAAPAAGLAVPGWAIALGVVAVAGLAFYLGRR
jgi:hypothetical protein